MPVVSYVSGGELWKCPGVWDGVYPTCVWDTMADSGHSYKDKAAFKAHGSSKEFKAMFGELGKYGLKDTKIDMKFVEKTGGFSSRL